MPMKPRKPEETSARIGGLAGRIMYANSYERFRDDFHAGIDVAAWKAIRRVAASAETQRPDKRPKVAKRKAKRSR